MDDFLKLSSNDRLEIFTEAQSRLGINAIVLEKDFWVCWVLEKLFNNKELSDNMIFKGGTSLSKSYQLIDRFSEDCDLTINRAILNIKDPSEANISGKEIQRRIDVLMVNIKAYIRDFILPILMNACQNSINSNEKWSLEIDQDEQTILFSYPTILNINTHDQYIKQVIKLELGARGGILPKQFTTIKPYIAKSFSTLLKEQNIQIPTLSVIRTFWEKLTILHGLYHRSLKGKEFAERMSRHYYDVYMLVKQGVDENALLNPSCLDDVVINNLIFFKDNNASQSSAKLGSLCLVPNDKLMEDLSQDYKNMAMMILGNAPDFKEIIKVIQNLEIKLNS
jgi:hypothetical protein